MRLSTVGIAAALAVACADDGGNAGDESTGGSTDASGTAAASSSASVDESAGAEPLLPEPGPSRYALVAEPVLLDGSASTGAVLYAWDPDDGSGPREPSAEPTLEVAYAEPGRRHPVLTVYDGEGAMLSASTTIHVTHEPSHMPSQSGTVIVLPDDRIAVVSPDSDEITLVVRTGDAEFAVSQRVGVCDEPRTLAWTGDRIAVACPRADAVALVDLAGDTVEPVALPRGSRPYGVIASGERLWVTLQALGRVAEIDLAAAVPTVVAELDAVADARGIALLPDGRLAVSRWRSLDDAAQIAAVDPRAGTVELATLQYDPKEASDTEAGGIPSWLDQILVSPQGDRIAIPSLQANFGQGEYLDGDPLTFEETLRGIVAYVAWPELTEDFELRKHFDNRGFMAAGVWSRFGDYLFLVDRGSRSVERVDAFTGGQAGGILDVGYAPSGLALGFDDRFLFVDAYMSRELRVYDVRDFSMLPPLVVALQIPSAEPLATAVLRGKQLFNDSYDPRLAKHGYIACAHCHLDGEADRRTWDFTDRGEGLRNTISLLGRAGVGQGPLHWSANFDEVQDFENDIRNAFGGTGLLDDADWRAGTHSQTLGDPKAGLSQDLDALAAYVESLAEVPKSPWRNPDGSLGAAAEAGRLLFESPALGCTVCHAGAGLTDSELVTPTDPLLHDVGTLTAASGMRMGEPLLGIDTPTLHELWNSPPYLHDGSAATLQDVLTSKNPADQHGVTSMLSASDVEALVAYLSSLEG